MPDASVEQIRTATLNAIHALTVGGAKSYSINGRSVTKNDLADLRQTYDWANAQLQGSTALVSVGYLDRVGR